MPIAPVSRAPLIAPGYYDGPRGLSPGLPKPGMSREGPAIHRGPVPRSKLLKCSGELPSFFALVVRANRYVPNREDNDHAVRRTRVCA